MTTRTFAALAALVDDSEFRDALNRWLSMLAPDSAGGAAGKRLESSPKSI